MAVNNISFHDPLTKPIVGSIIHDYINDNYKIFDGKHWIIAEMNNNDHAVLTEWYTKWFNKEKLSDEYLEQQYPELKQQKEEYEQMRDKLKVFEILKQNDI